MSRGFSEVFRRMLILRLFPVAILWETRSVYDFRLLSYTNVLVVNNV